MSICNIFNDVNQDIYCTRTNTAGSQGELPLTLEMLVKRPSGDIFGMTMNTGMGWAPTELDRDDTLLPSTLGELYQGHYELDIQIKAAAEMIKPNQTPPYAVYVSDPCDGWT